MGQKQKRIRQKEWQDQAEEQERYIEREREKWDQTDSPEIPDRKDNKKSPRHPFTGAKSVKATVTSKVHIS